MTYTYSRLDNPQWVDMALAFLAEPGDKPLADLLDEYDYDADGRRLALAQILDGSTLATAGERERWLARYDEQAIVAALQRLAAVGGTMLTPNDLRYPAGFHRLRAKPATLFVRGAVGKLDHHRRIAIVGARAATGYGDHVTGEFTAGAVRDGYVVVSGAAYGIDGAAHRNVLHHGGTTVAVLAGGIDRPYPAGHRELIERVGYLGVVMSEVPPGSAPTKHRFLERNRLIGAMSDAMLVVEAGYRSGSLGAAHRAHDIDVPIFAVPGPITSPTSAGTHALIREGKAKLVTNWAELSSELND